jgi:hypothetical protein
VLVAADADGEWVEVEEEIEGLVGGGWRAAAILFALTTLALGGALVYGFFQLVEYRDDARYLEQRLPFYAVQLPLTGEDLLGTVYISQPRLDRGVIVVNGLPQNEPGQVYVVWIERNDGTVEFNRVFLVTGEERVHLDITRLPRTFARLFITVEPSNPRPAEPTGAELASAQSLEASNE